MKTLTLAIFCVAITFCSCQKGITDIISTTPGGSSTPGIFKAKIDGVQWTAAAGMYGAVTMKATAGFPPSINIAGKSTDKKQIAIVLTDSGVHQYTIFGDALNNNAGYYQDSSASNVTNYTTNQAYIASPPNGSVKITKIDTVAKTISGTFNFIVYRQQDSTKINITDGEFTNIPYQTDALPSSSNTDTFNVKIDGAAFVPYSITGTNFTPTSQMIIQGANQSLDKNVALTFPSNITTGTYTLDFFGFTHYGLLNEGTLSFGSTSGTMQILEHNTSKKRIRGTFNFSGEQLTSPVPVRQLTEGYFSVVYN